jgi:hypothetical protein
MAPVKEIVDVQITRGSVNISQVGFGTILILSAEPNFHERLRYFSDLESVADALLLGTTGAAYKAASAIFSQNPKCTRLALGNRAASKQATFTGTFTGGTIVFTVNGVEVTVPFNTNLDTTIADAVTAINGACPNVVASSFGGMIEVAPAAGYCVGISIVLNVNSGNTLAFTYGIVSNEEDATVALNAVQQYNPDWYGLILTSRKTVDVMAAAAWTEAADMKVFVTASADTNILDAGETGDIASLFKSLGYLKSQACYSLAAGTAEYLGPPTTEYPDAARLGKILPYAPGSYTEAFKTLAGISTDLLTTTQRTAAFDKNADVYEYVGGVNITRQGKVGCGEYLDVVIFIDWLKARCTESIYQILVSNLKVPYTDAGIASVENALTQPLKAGQNAGGISPTAFNDQKIQIGGYYITVPRLQDVPLIDKTSRTLNNVKFVAFLAGAIHIVKVQGTVTL